MEKRPFIASIAQTDDDKILLARVYERITGAAQKNIPAATCFLSPREQALAAQLPMDTALQFFGGGKQVERAVGYYLPEYLEPEDWLYAQDGPVCALRANFFAGDSLSHRDFLGSLMGSGIKRETVGDIFVGEGSCDFLVTREIAPYVLANFESAGRTKLTVQEISLLMLAVPVEKLREIRGTVATLRLDSIVSAGYQISRGKAADMISAGRVSLNGLACEKPDKSVLQGDTVAVRGLGKMALTCVGGATKKGRLGIIISRYE